MNKKLYFVVMGLVLGISTAGRAIESSVGSRGDLGLGIELGQPMGATGKYWLSKTMAIDGAGGYHFNGNFDAHADFLENVYPNFGLVNGRMPVYLGLGARILGGNDSQFGLRFPIGVSDIFPTDPVEAFAEIAPVMKLTSGIGYDIDGVVGVRFYLQYLK